MKKMFVFLLLFFIFFSTQIFASSPYVLPYPSTMPGGISYKLHVLWENIVKYWYYGDFGQFLYNQKESDKYLVEAKTLFEYQQYLLGFQALQKSNLYFEHTLPFLLKAHQHGKNITIYRVNLHDEAQKHVEWLKKMEQETPVQVTWSPEKSAASRLPLHVLIDTSITIRQSYE